VKKPDILIFLSDQHSGLNLASAGDTLVRTPNLEQIAKSGTSFDVAYTSCPLCVPSRVSMLTGQLPSKTGIYTNKGAIAEDQATFIHSIAAEGYETVLCGRMHFVGDDQRHGFTKRLVGDICPLYWGTPGHDREDLGAFKGSLAVKYCLNVIGKGTSPVLEYDNAVIEAALDYLNQPHDKPQLIVVGTYAPHFPYVAPPELFDYYRERVKLPSSMDNELNYHHPLMAAKEMKAEKETILNARAAYYGMIENMDRQIGCVREAWQEYLLKNDRKGIFIYLSDHGDQIGERNLFGKQTFFEGSSKIPLIFEGDGIKADQRIQSPASIMDLGPTLCDIIGATVPPEQDGISLINQIIKGEELNERHVYSEYIEKDKSGNFIPGRMVRKGPWKLISYAFHEQYDLLFNVEKDPGEFCNLIEQYPELVKELRTYIEDGWNIQQQIQGHESKMAHYDILTRWGQKVKPEQAELWKIPLSAQKAPKPYREKTKG